MIHCLMVAGHGINDDIRDILFDIAQEIYQKDEFEHTIKSPWLEGKITTQYKQAMLGDLGGIIFHAHIESNHGETKVNYIVRPSDLRSCDGTWVLFNLNPPVPYGMPN